MIIITNFNKLIEICYLLIYSQEMLSRDANINIDRKIKDLPASLVLHNRQTLFLSNKSKQLPNINLIELEAF